MRATVFVRPKPGILDPQGQAVESSLRQLGFCVSRVQVGRLIELDVSEADEADVHGEVEKMCEQLLANSLIETYEIEICPNEREQAAGVESAPSVGVKR